MLDVTRNLAVRVGGPSGNISPLLTVEAKVRAVFCFVFLMHNVSHRLRYRLQFGLVFAQCDSISELLLTQCSAAFFGGGSHGFQVLLHWCSISLTVLLTKRAVEACR